MKTLHRNTPARGYGHKRAIDSNGNTRLTLYHNGQDGTTELTGIRKEITTK